MNFKTKFIRFFKSKDLLSFNLDNYGVSNILFVTGLSGSGKSTKATKLGKRYNAIVFELDNLGGFYGKFKNSKELIHELTKNFLKSNQELDEIIRKNKFVKLKIENFNEYSNWIIKYFEYLVHFCNNNEKLYIFEGTQIFKCINPNYFVNKPLIILRTSVLKSFIRRIKRQVNFRKNGLGEFKHLKKLIIDSKRLHYEDVKVIDNFLYCIEKAYFNF